MAQDLSVFGAAGEYWADAWQRGVLFLETLNQRGNIQVSRGGQGGAARSELRAELVLDGRTLTRPVNYALVRIVPPEGAHDRSAKPPVHRRRSARRPRARASAA